jgi:hypothetical protein
MKERLLSNEFLSTSMVVNIESSQQEVYEIKYLDIDPTRSAPDSEISKELSLRLMSKMGVLQEMSVTAKNSSSQYEDIKKYHGIDLGELTGDVIQNEIIQGLIKELYEKYKSLGELSKDLLYTGWQKIILSYFKKLKITKYVDDSTDGIRLIIASILHGSNMIAVKSRRGGAKFAICSPGIGAILQDSRSFICNTTGNVSPSDYQGYIHRIGQIAGINIFINPFLKVDDGTVTLGRVTLNNDPGVYTIFKSPEFPKIENETDNTGTIKYSITYAGLHPEDSYINVNFTIGKKPFWKKILGI